MLQAFDTLPGGSRGDNDQAALGAGRADLPTLRRAAEAAYARYCALVSGGADDAALEAAFNAYTTTVDRMAAIPARDVVGFAAKAAVARRGVFDGFADCEARLMESLADDAAAVLP